MKLDTETLRQLIREAIEQQKPDTTVASATSRKTVGSFRTAIMNVLKEIPDDANADDLEIILQIFKYFVGVDKQVDLAQNKQAVQVALNTLTKKLSANKKPEPVKEGCGMSHPMPPEAMPHTPMVGGGISDDDHEVEMAISDLHKLEEYAPKISQLAQDYSNLPGWVQAKITLAADYLGKVYHYLDGKHKQGM